jgi:hypothetical protein
MVFGPEKFFEMSGDFLLFVIMRDGQALHSLKDLDLFFSFPAIGPEVKKLCVGSVMLNIYHSGSLLSPHSL